MGSTSVQEIERRSNEQKKSGFDTWLRRAEVRMLLSMMGPNEHLENLLRAAFEAGFSAGEASVALLFAQKMVEDVARRNK